MHHKLPAWTLIAGLLLAGGCQPGNIKPDSAGNGNAIELQQQAYKAYSEGDWAEAEKAYVALTKEIPQEPDPWFRLGNIYARLERPAQAVAAYQEALVRDPENGKAWHNMGIVQLRQAMNSFMNLEAATKPGDPLNDRANIMLDTVSTVLETDFDAGTEEPLR